MKTPLIALVILLFCISPKAQAQADNSNIEKRIREVEGRQQISEVFGNFLENFETVYHFNGQHIVSLDGNKATGILYCTTYLINSEEGKRMKRSIGIHYNDEYVKIDGIWFISKRTSMFDWQDLQEMDQ